MAIKFGISDDRYSWYGVRLSPRENIRYRLAGCWFFSDFAEFGGLLRTSNPGTAGGKNTSHVSQVPLRQVRSPEEQIRAVCATLVPGARTSSRPP
jgi:hypothetical protein